MRTLSYVNFLRGQARECDNLAVMCMDFRFHRRVCDLLSYAGYRDYNLMALPGASKSVLSETSRETVISAIRLVVDAHGVKRVIIVDHVDCRAYGGSEAFPNAAAEEQAHRDALSQAANVISESFPKLQVVGVYADWDRVKQID